MSTANEILTELLAAISDSYQKTVGYPTHDLLAAAALPLSQSSAMQAAQASTSQPSHPNAAVKAPHSAATAAFAYKKPFFLSKFPFIFKHSIHFCTNQRPPARG